MTQLQQIHTKLLTRAEIEALYPLVNNERDWQIDVNSHELVDKIIALWFEVNHNITFWSNPNYEVTEWSVNNKNEIEFSYYIYTLK